MHTDYSFLSLVVAVSVTVLTSFLLLTSSGRSPNAASNVAPAYRSTVVSFVTVLSIGAMFAGLMAGAEVVLFGVMGAFAFLVSAYTTYSLLGVAVLGVAAVIALQDTVHGMSLMPATVGLFVAAVALVYGGYMLDRGIHSVLEFGIGCQLLGLVAHVLLPSNFSLGEYGSIITLACLVSSIKHRALRSGVALGLLSIIASALLMLRVPNLFYALLPTLGACVVMALRRRNLRVVLGPYSDMERLARIWGCVAVMQVAWLVALHDSDHMTHTISLRLLAVMLGAVAAQAGVALLLLLAEVWEPASSVQHQLLVLDAAALGVIFAVPVGVLWAYKMPADSLRDFLHTCVLQLATHEKLSFARGLAPSMAMAAFASLLAILFFVGQRDLFGSSIMWASLHAEVHTCALQDKRVEGKPVALTFDSDPHEQTTPAVLQALRDLDVPATFFVNGTRARNAPAVVKRMVEEGHHVGVAGMLDTPLLALPRSTRAELEEAIDAVTHVTEERPKFYRPPHGFRFPTQLAAAHRAGLHVCLWSIMPWGDSPPGTNPHMVSYVEENAPSRVTESVLAQLSPVGGDIIRLPSDHKGVTEVLRRLVPALKEHGCRFVTVDEICGLDTVEA